MRGGHTWKMLPHSHYTLLMIPREHSILVDSQCKGVHFNSSEVKAIPFQKPLAFSDHCGPFLISIYIVIIKYKCIYEL